MQAGGQNRQWKWPVAAEPQGVGLREPSPTSALDEPEAEKAVYKGARTVSEYRKLPSALRAFLGERARLLEEHVLRGRPVPPPPPATTQ